MDTVTIRIDGIEVQVPKAWAQVVQQGLDRRDSKITELNKQVETLQGRCDAQVKDLDDAKKKLVVAEDPKRLDSAVADRVALVAAAGKVLDQEFKFDGKSKREIQEAVLKKHDDKLDLAGKSDDYVQARYDHVIDTVDSGTSQRSDALDQSRRDTSSRQAPASQQADKRAQRADDSNWVPDWQRPTTVTKQN